MALARPRSQAGHAARPRSQARAIPKEVKELTPKEKEREKALMLRIGNECFEVIKGISGTHVYLHQKANAISLLLHHDWLCELRHAMRPRRTHIGYTSDAFAHMRRRDALLDGLPPPPDGAAEHRSFDEITGYSADAWRPGTAIDETDAPMSPPWRPGTAPRFLAEGVPWPAHVRPATAIDAGEPPNDWPQFCKAFCITLKEGTRVQHLRLLFEAYSRDQPGAISANEARSIVLKHVQAKGRVEDRPAKNAAASLELGADFDSVAHEGHLDCVAFEDLWRRHMPVFRLLKIDVWCLLQDLGARDAAERAVVRKPFEAKKADAWGIIDRKLATDVANFKETL